MSDLIRSYNEFIEDNLYKRYPLTDYVNVNSSIIPDSFMADIKLCINVMDRPGDDSYRYSMYVSKITVYPDYAYVEFKDLEDDIVIAKTDPISMRLSMADSVEDRTIMIRPVTTIPVNGTLVVGTCVDIKNIKGVHILTPDEGRLFPSNIIITTNAGVDAIVVGRSRLTGDVTIEAGDYIDIDADTTTNTIKISVDTSNINLSTSDIIKKLKDKYGNPVRTINGIYPDSDGNIQIDPTDCFMVTTDGANHNISFYNPCAPACASYEFVNESLRRIKELNDTMDLLRSYYESTANTLAQMGVRVSAVIESRKTTDPIESGSYPDTSESGTTKVK